MTDMTLLAALGWAVAGAGLGAVYLALIGRSVAAVASDRPASGAVLWFALRLALAAGAFWVAAQSGAVALLSAMAGFLVARSVVLARARRG